MMHVVARILLMASVVVLVASARHDPDLSHYARVSQEPDFTRSYSYVSPREAETRFTRAAEPKHADETDSYKAFLDKYFSDSTANRPDYSAERNQKLRKEEDTERIDGNSREYDDNFHDTEYERIKAVSMEQEKEIKKNPKNCKVTVKDGMQCSICKNPKTGSHSETCSFSSTPPEKKYAYVKERNYNSKDQEKEKQKKADDEEEDEDEDDEEEDEDDGEDEKKSEASTTNVKKVRSSSVAPSPPPSASPKPITRNRGPPMAKQSPTNRPMLRQPARSQSLRAATPTSSTSKHHSYHSSYKTTAPETRPKRRVIGLDPYLYGSHSSDAKSEQQLKKRQTDDTADDDKSVEEDPKDRTYEDYFSHVFPEAKNGRLTRDDDEGRSAADDVEFVPDYESKKNVEKVLAEFKTKDWSTCKKEIRGDLTCYLCKDDNGVRHEECMFVSGSGSKKEPKSSRLSYSETKEFHTPTTKAEPRKSENLRVAEQSDEPSQGSDDDDEGEDEEVTTKKPTKKKKKYSRKVVIRRRKTKELRPEHGDAEEASAQDAGEHQSGGTKKTIKRMVSYEIKNVGANDDDDSTEGRSMAYEHQVIHHAA